MTISLLVSLALGRLVSVGAFVPAADAGADPSVRPTDAPTVMATRRAPPSAADTRLLPILLMEFPFIARPVHRFT
jgi:hypothetical protein